MHLKQLTTSVAFVAMLAVATAESQAVILYRSATRNTTAPTGQFANSGWQLQGQFGNFLGTPIAPQYFLTAAHLGGSPNNTIVLNGVTYPIDTSFVGSGPGWINDPGTDLRIWKIQGTFPAFAPLWDQAVDGSEIGKTMIVYGRGTARGKPVYALRAGPPRDGSAPRPTPGPGGDVKPSELTELKGWEWGAFDSVQAWGTNVVTGAFNAGGGFGNVLYFDFDRLGLSDEGALSNGDSGGAVFIQSGSTWKLAAINLSADGPWQTSLERPAFLASIFDAGGLYINGQAVTDFSFDVPGSSYSTQVSPRLSWIRSVTGLPIGESSVPEPAMFAVLAPATLALLRRRPP